MSLTHRLRSWTFSVDAAPASDLMDEAANEIERLRLTDAEREAIRMSIAACEVEKELNIACDGRQSFAGMWSDRADALRSLLERTK